MLRSILGWMAGRKTYLLAVLLFLVVGALVFLGKLTPQTAMTVALFALGGFAVTFRSALAGHQAQVLALLADIAAAGVAVRTGDKKAQAAVAVQAYQDAIALTPALQSKDVGGLT